MLFTKEEVKSMTRPNLSLVRNTAFNPAISFEEKLADHNAVLQGYIDTFYTRNCSHTTIKTVGRFLRGWFKEFIITDPTHPEGERQLLVWEAMAPTLGRQHITAFTKGLICSA